MIQGPYQLERIRQEHNSRMNGLILTLAVHAILIGIGFFAGFKYLYPPPPEKESILIEFEQEFELEIDRSSARGFEPRVEMPDPTRDIHMVQASKSHVEGTKANKAPATMIDEFGDVEVKQPKREEVIDKRGLFSAANNETDIDTLAQQTARTVTDALKEGHASGNIVSGTQTGEPNARLQGRTVIKESLARPAYTVNQSGIVVVSIKVDNYGTVIEAKAGAEGTTVTNKDLWNAARQAALKTRFKQSLNAPAVQEGTITYIFKIE